MVEQINPPYEDPPQPLHNGESPQEHAVSLARAKAESVVNLFCEGLKDDWGHTPLLQPLAEREAVDDLPLPCVILSADTICVSVEGDLLGQPATRDEARTMIQSFVSADHDVVSGVALASLSVPGQGREVTWHCFADTATVRFGELDDAVLARYLDTDQWQGKAGGYNLFDQQRNGWPIEVLGDETTVVGLPMIQLRPALELLGVRPVATANADKQQT
ncbi:MAG: Maf family protein [Rhodospirillales bacterium]|nr:Maf family protein [Rhodospirillales bacterium]